MPDLPISQLPAATLPLDGTEPVPVVQAGVTCQAPASSFTNFSAANPYTWTALQTFEGSAPTDLVQSVISGSIGVNNGTINVFGPGNYTIIQSYYADFFANTTIYNKYGYCLNWRGESGKPNGTLGGLQYAAQMRSSINIVTICDSLVCIQANTSGGTCAVMNDGTNSLALCNGSNAIAVVTGTSMLGEVTGGVWHGTPIDPAYGGTGGLTGPTATWQKFTVPFGEFSSGSTTQRVTVISLPAQQFIGAIAAKVSVAFSASGLSALSLTVQVVVSGTPAPILGTLNGLVAATSTSADVGTHLLNFSTTTDIAVLGTATGANLNTLSTGELDLWLLLSLLP
jgi:hypothetical protein